MQIPPNIPPKFIVDTCLTGSQPYLIEPLESVDDEFPIIFEVEQVCFFDGAM